MKRAALQSVTLTTALWGAVVAIALTLLVVRFCAATTTDQTLDLGAFLAASRSIVDGGNPWTANGYVYSPFIALVLIPISASSHAQEIVTIISLACGIAAIAAVTAVVEVRRGQKFVKPIVAGTAVVTLLWNVPTSLQLWIGNVDIWTMATIAVGGLLYRKRPALGAGVLAVGSLIKTWPAGTAVWLFRRGARRRGRSIATYLGVLLLGPIATVVLFGWSGLKAWLKSTFTASQQDLGPHSLFSALAFAPRWSKDGLGTVPFGSHALGWLISIVILGVVLSLLLVALRRPGDIQLCLWHVVTCMLLLLPVSHLYYYLLGLPLLWLWVGRIAVARFHGGRHWAACTSLGIWWIVAFRWTPTSTIGYLAIMTTTIVSLAVSVISAAGLATNEPTRRPAQPTKSPNGLSREPLRR